jgi:putative two-component system response regulator
VAIADVFDALTHGRPYAESWSPEKALDEIRRLAGIQFDPDICSSFIGLITDLLRSCRDLDLVLTDGADSSPFITARRRIERMILHVRPRAHPAADESSTR